MSNYSKYLPEKEVTVRVQAKIPKSLHKKAKGVLDNKKLTWDEFIEGLVQKYMDDNRV